jgi:hypothetical protein
MDEDQFEEVIGLPEIVADAFDESHHRLPSIDATMND